MDRGAWQVTKHKVTELDTIERTEYDHMHPYLQCHSVFRAKTHICMYICLLNKYLLTAYYILDTIFGTPYQQQHKSLSS